MSFNYLVSFLILITQYYIVKCKIITITSIPITNAGKWDTMASCGPDSFVKSFSLKRERRVAGANCSTNITCEFSTVAITNVRLYCEPLASAGKISVRGTQISSGEDNWWGDKPAPGTWGADFHCQGFGTGFELRVNKKLKIYDARNKDWGATSNFRMYCSHGPKYIEGDGYPLGNWSDKPKMCKPKMAVCGIRTQTNYEPEATKTGYIGINNIKLKCCSLQTKLECKPSSNWELILTCDNTLGTETLECSYSAIVGVGNHPSTTEHESYQTSLLHGLEIGYQDTIQENIRSPGYITSYLRSFFNSYEEPEDLDEQLKTNYKWKEANLNMWRQASFGEGAIRAEAGKKVELFQVVGKCGHYIIRTTRIMRREKGTSKAQEVIKSEFDLKLGDKLL